MSPSDGWNSFYSFFWNTGLTLDEQTLRETSLSRFKCFFALAVGVSLYYNFPYLFLRKDIGFPLDDAWIHMTFAKNIFYHKNFSFDGIHLSTGSSSFLWPLIISVFSSLPSYLAVAAVHLINSIVFFLLICTWYQLLLNMFLDETLAFLAAFLTPFCGNLLWIVFSGMESILFLFLGLLSVYFYGERKYLAVGVLNAVLVLVRPEGIALALAFATIEIYRLFRRSGSNPRDSVAIFLPPFISLLIYFAINYYITGNYISTSFSGSRWLHMFPEHVPILSGTYYGAKHLLNSWYQQIINFSAGWGWMARTPLVKGFFSFPIKFCGNFVFFSGILFYVISFFIGIRPPYSYGVTSVDPWGFIKKNQRWKRFEVSLVLWTLYHNLAYSFFLPTPGQGGRYQPINLLWMVIFFVMGLRGCGEIFSMLLKRYEKQIKHFLSFLFASVTLVMFWYWGFVYQGCVSHINNVHIRAAEWVKHNIPLQDTIAAFDIGAMGYFSDRVVLDLGGLVDPKCTSHLFNKTLISYLKENQVKYMAMVEKSKPSSGIEYRLGIPQANGKVFDLELLYKVGLGKDEGFHRRATNIAYPKICIYKVKWREIS